MRKRISVDVEEVVIGDTRQKEVFARHLSRLKEFRAD